MNFMPYDEPKSGERVTPKMRRYKMQCCDCGLVHDLSFIAVRVTRTKKDGSWCYVDLPAKKFRVVFKVWRNNRATGQVRRHRNITVKRHK